MNCGTIFIYANVDGEYSSFLLMVGPEVFHGITADQPGEGGAQNSDNQFNNCDHAGLLLLSKQRIKGGSMKGAMYIHMTEILEKVTAKILQKSNFPPVDCDTLERLRRVFQNP
jgi:hypothetical protein